MPPTRTRDAMLTAIGFAAWLFYILGCASFSPDDSKVLFPSNDPKTGGPIVCMYDRAALTSRALLSVPQPRDASNDGILWVRSLWAPDGLRVVSMWAEGNEALRVMVLPLAAKEPVRLLTVTDAKDDIPSPFLMPPPIVGSRLFIGEKEQIRRVDLDGGAELASKVEGEPLLVGLRDRVYYGRGLPKGADGKDRVEFGTVDATTLALTPMFQTTDVPGGDTPFFAVSRDGARLAIPGGKNDAPEILIFEAASSIVPPPRRLPLATEADGIRAGEFQWSRDGATVYCVYRKTLADDQYQFGVLEVPTSGRPIRQIPLFGVTGKVEDGEIFAFQIDVSHDGKTLAAASTYLQTPPGKKEAQRLKPADLALYLVDLARSDRRVTKVPIPPFPAATQAVGAR